MIGLRISDLNFSYANRILLKNITINLLEPGITGITGNNGSGKSTFLRLIHGLIKPNTGTIEWTGIPTPKIGMVFQKPLMLRRSVIANINFVLNFHDTKTDPLQSLQILDLDHLAYKPARSLSGGEQQKLAIARVIALQPDVILLDEPTAHIDYESSLKIEKLFIQLSEQGKKIFIVSHDNDQVLRIAQNVLRLQEGDISCCAL